MKESDKMTNEMWLPVVNFEGLYEVSNFGNVRSIDRIIIRSNGTLLPLKGKEIHQQKYRGNSNIYRLRVCISKDNIVYTKSVHRLVAEAFIPNPNNLPQVNHIDENPLNNNVNNLEWCTNEYNHNYGTRNKRQAEKLKKKVNMYDLNMRFIKQYNSIKEAAKDINGDESSITKVCKGKNKYHKQYIFKYA